METPRIVHADTDQHGAKKENIFIALDENGAYLGSLLIYPFFDDDLEPEHPHNLYLYIHSGQDQGPSESVKDALLENALQRATEIKREAKQTKTRVYACFVKDQEKEMAYFLQRGFIHDEGMYILERQGLAELPEVDAPQAVNVQSWDMATAAEQHQFIEAHRKIFPRHPYTIERLQELKALPGWRNFTAFSNTEIAGNIMVFIQDDNRTVGYIEDLFVSKPWRRRGIARYLLSTALTYFQNVGIQRVQLEMWSANKPAFALYRAFGFSAIDETELAVGRYV